MVAIRRYIMRGLLAFGLWLMAVGTDATVTYHIISLATGTNNSYRIEALRCTSNETIVQLPAAYVSPLATNFHYYSSATITNNVKIWTGNNTQFNTYSAFSGELTKSSDVGDVTDIYVTYEYDSAAAATLGLDLTGSTEYNIQLGNYFLAFNYKRGDRPAAIPVSSVTDMGYLVSDDFNTIANAGNSNLNNVKFYFKWKMTGSDPYNIVLMSTYVGNLTSKPYANARLYAQMKDTGTGGNNIWLDNKNNFNKMNPIWWSFALLPHATSNYTLMGVNINSNNSNWQPNSKGQYAYLSHNDSFNPQMMFSAADKADQVIFNKIKTYRYKVKTPLTNTEISGDIEWSDYYKDRRLSDTIPDKVLRKYCNYTNFYCESTFNNELTTFADADTHGTTEDGKKVVWIKYESTFPFNTGSSSDGFGDLSWYNLYVNKETQYVLNYDDLTPDGSKGFNTRGGHRGENESQFAFVGDPYEMKIVSRGASTESTLHYLKYDTDGNPLTEGADGNAWEIIYDKNTGDYASSFRFRKFNTYDTPKYLSWMYGNETYASWPVSGNASQATRIWALEVPSYDYVYHIMRNDNTFAVKATASMPSGHKFSYNNIPEIVRSPFIADATLKFYWTLTDAESNTNEQTHATDDVENNGYDVYVKYTSVTDMSGDYNVRLNGEYIYYDTGSASIKSVADISSHASDTYYQWTLNIADPYAMTIKNIGYNKFVKVATWKNDATLEWDDAEANATLFIAKSSTYSGVYEVMAATGNGVDAATTYYNIARQDNATIKMYDNATYPHGYNQLRFLLSVTSSANITYHLIDKSNTELLQVVARQSSTDDARFPTDYWSPLVATYHYYSDRACASAITKVGENTDIYVTYDTNSLVNLQRGQMYLLRYDQGDYFRQENGGDDLLEEVSDMTTNTYRYKAVYPYCNGDCNFFVYGDEQYDIQQEGAASTRTRWAWYLESSNNDPYHVKICSRQTEIYNGDERRAYFRTSVETFGNANHVVTSLTWPGISGIAGTEYMVLGTEGQYRLLTTATIPIDLNNDGDTSDAGENEHQTVSSFEQYWKTWDTIRKKVLGDNGATEDANAPITVPATPATEVASEAGKDNRTYLTDVKGWHNYSKWAYAKRWNGMNASEAKNKGWEEIEHWFQTIGMGEGYFDLVPVTIDPAMILLDQHGWEIMRKPLPTGEDDPDRDAKLAELRVYDSPMVKEYSFWCNASKLSGYHKYTLRLQNDAYRDPVSVNGVQYTATSLANLPPYDATNVKDNKGNLYDLYITYTTKEEYLLSYNKDTQVGQPFLIQQGDKYLSTSDGSSITTNDVPTTGGMSEYIIDNATSISNNVLWYVKPNANIDSEMGYSGDAVTYSPTATDWRSDEFDPYNIQITSVAYNTKYLINTNATATRLEEGSLVGTYSGDATISLGNQATTIHGTWYDSRTLNPTNATFMAVQDGEGNMQLMPRFDHQRRMRNFSSLATPNSLSGDDVKEVQTKLFIPRVYEYQIIDNSGNNSLKYKRGGDLVPQIPNQFKSPLAKNFTFYTDNSCNNKIESSLAGSGLTETTNNVFVRYQYDKDADDLGILQGKWLTMKLNNHDMQYDNPGLYYAEANSSTKPDPVDGNDQIWQWKFLDTSLSDPDPYNINLYNRSKTDGAALSNSGALLSHTNGGYVLAKIEGDYTYKTLHGKGELSTAASYSTESGLKTGSSLDEKSQILLFDDIQHTYTYKVYTNESNFAVSATQENDEAKDNNEKPVLPTAAQSPLLNIDQYRYYGATADMGVPDKEIKNLYGLYDDTVYVRYTTYEAKESSYLVPNERTTNTSQIERANSSNDAPLGLDGNLLYNIIWFANNTMRANSTSIEGSAGLSDLQGTSDYEWTLEGEDPYAIKIKNMNNSQYIYTSDHSTCSLDDNSTTFMLLNQDGYQYGVLQETGQSNKLTGVGSTMTASAPTEFIIFALSTYQVTYRLVINNIGSYVDIPYAEIENNARIAMSDKRIHGTTQRDLTNYPIADVDVGHISLGAPLEVPNALKRPNCDYDFYVDHINYKPDDVWVAYHDMEEVYKGLKMTEMGTNALLLGTHVYINIVYHLVGAASEDINNFVTTKTGTEWYSWETDDATPKLARYTNTGGFTTSEGRDMHNTNDYLWKPVGDPYGFKMYNRYEYKNRAQTGMAMSAESLIDNQDLTIATETGANAIYEMLVSETNDAYFNVHPVAETAKTLFVHNDDGHLKLSTTATNWWFGLDDKQMQPYLDRAGYVGGLKADKVTAFKACTTTAEKQTIVYDDDNIVQYTPGYYRLHSMPDAVDVSTVRYASGYSHAIERDLNGDSNEDDAIPMHFCEQELTPTTFEELSSGGVLNKGFTNTAATRGEIPILAALYDPASIFRFTGSTTAVTISTQGLNVLENKMTTGAGTSYKIEDIGAACIVIYTGNINGGYYLNYRQDNPDHIYDLYYSTGEINDHTKWCMRPVQKESTAKTGEMALRLTTHNGGEGSYYTTICVPFDVKLIDENTSAYVCTTWNSEMIHPQSIGTTINAGTPAIIRTKSTTGYVTLSIPGTTSTPTSCIFSSKYLEQKLDAGSDVYTFGLPFSGTWVQAADYTTTGNLTATLPLQESTGIGFYKNANRNKELGSSSADWTRNNWYVLANKIYYRAGATPGVSPAPRRAIEYIPVVFDEDGEEEENGREEAPMFDGRIYNLQGRCVATEQEVSEGSWRQKLAPGVYIRNGKKMVITRR